MKAHAREGLEVVADLAGLLERAERTCVAAAYTAGGGGNGVTISGTVEDLAEPFTLDGVVDGGTIVLSYVPDADGRSGTYSYTGSGGGFALTGNGTYVVTGDEGGPLTLTQDGQGCVDTYCASGTEVVTLTPVE